MKTMKFLTTAKCMGCVANIDEQMEKILRKGEWKMDLSTKELTVTADIAPEKVIEAVRAAGLQATQLP